MIAKDLDSINLDNDEFKVDDIIEQAFRSGYNAGVADAIGLRQENNMLRREVAFYRCRLEARSRNDDIDSEYE